MPYIQRHVEPKVFTRQQGLRVYHSYDDDNYDEPLSYHYTTAADDTDHELDKFEFDVRDIAAQLEEQQVIDGFDDSIKGHRLVIKKAIQLQLLKFP